MWKSQESERRLRDPIEGRRDRSDAVYSSPLLPRPNLLAVGPVTSPGFASKILGGFTGPLPPPVDVDPAILGCRFGYWNSTQPRCLNLY